MKWKPLIKIITVIILLLIILPLSQSIPPFFEVFTVTERHGLTDHEIILNVTNTDEIEHNYNFRASIKNKHEFPIRKTRAYYQEEITTTWETPDKEINESAPYKCTLPEGNTTCYETYTKGIITRTSTKKEWVTSTISKEGGDYIEATMKNPIKTFAPGESALIKIAWNVPNKLTRAGYESIGGWEVNPGGYYNSSYGFRNRINITAGPSGMKNNFTINLTLPKEVVGNSTSSGDDIIIVWNNSDTLTEIDRLNTTAFTDGQTANIWFKLQASIEASKTNQSYFVYYNNSAPAKPLNATNNVFSRIPEQNEAGCVAGWSFREGAGRQTNNTCGNKNESFRGTLKNNVVWNATDTPPVDNKTQDRPGSGSPPTGENGTIPTWEFAGDYGVRFGSNTTSLDAIRIPPKNWTTVFGTENGGNYSIEAWVYTNFHQANQIIFIVYDPLYGKNIFLRTTYTSMEFVAWGQALTATGFFTRWSWQHVVATRQGTNMTIYINAKVVATAIKNASTTNSPGLLNGSIGNLGGPLAQGFNGTIDELMIYNRTLTANEIYYHYWRRAHPTNAWKTTMNPAEPPPDITAPNVTILIPPNGTTFDLGTNLTAQFRVQGNDSSIIERYNVTLSYPNGTQEVINMTPLAGTEYNASFTLPNLQGFYNASFNFIDEYENSNSTEIVSFEIRHFDRGTPGTSPSYEYKNISFTLISGENTTNTKTKGPTTITLLYQNFGEKHAETTRCEGTPCKGLIWEDEGHVELKSGTARILPVTLLNPPPEPSNMNLTWGGKKVVINLNQDSELFRTAKSWTTTLFNLALNPVGAIIIAITIIMLFPFKKPQNGRKH